MPESVIYTALRPVQFRERLSAAPVAYLPLGTLEWHGEHLPLGTDCLLASGFFEALAQRVGGVVLPPLFLGPDRREVQDGQEFFGMDAYSPGPDGNPRQFEGSAYWVDDDLFERIVEAALRQLARAGFRVVVAHGHGPSTTAFSAHIPQWRKRFGLQLLTAWREDESDGLGVQTDHAAANETSLMLALHPELVRLEALPGDPAAWPEGVLGQDPRQASAETGRKIIETQIECMARSVRAALAPNT